MVDELKMQVLVRVLDATLGKIEANFGGGVAVVRFRSPALAALVRGAPELEGDASGTVDVAPPDRGEGPKPRKKAAAKKKPAAEPE